VIIDLELLTDTPSVRWCAVNGRCLRSHPHESVSVRQTKWGAAQLLTVTEMGASMASLFEVSLAWIVIECAPLVS
jgi:hypothetical protein